VARWMNRLTRCPRPQPCWVSASRSSGGTSSPSGLVVMSHQAKHVGQLLWRGFELPVQDIGKSAFFGFDPTGLGDGDHLQGAVDAPVATAVETELAWVSPDPTGTGAVPVNRA
jgi:hypothetical protein